MIRVAMDLIFQIRQGLYVRFGCRSVYYCFNLHDLGSIACMLYDIAKWLLSNSVYCLILIA